MLHSHKLYKRENTVWISYVSACWHVSSPKQLNGFLLNFVLGLFSLKFIDRVYFGAYRSLLTPALHGFKIELYVKYDTKVSRYTKLVQDVQEKWILTTQRGK